MTLCYYYNYEHEIIQKEIDIDYNVDVFFRKYTEDDNERIICKKLFENQHANIVKIYNLSSNYIDMEYLDTIDSINDNLLLDINNALEHLHNLKIVYIDLKKDNIGFSKKENCYKLFDFNMSGIIDDIDDMIWKVKPNKGYILRKITDKYNITSLFDIDKYSIQNINLN